MDDDIPAAAAAREVHGVAGHDIDANADARGSFDDTHYAAFKDAFGAEEVTYDAESKSLQFTFFGIPYKATPAFTEYLHEVVTDKTRDYKYAARAKLLPPLPNDAKVDDDVEAKAPNGREQKNANHVDHVEQKLALEENKLGNNQVNLFAQAGGMDANHNRHDRQVIDLAGPHVQRVVRRNRGNVVPDHDAVAVIRRQRSSGASTLYADEFHDKPWKRHDRSRTDLEWPTEKLVIQPRRHRQNQRRDVAVKAFVSQPRRRQNTRILEYPTDAPPLIVTARYQPMYIDVAAMEDNAWGEQYRRAKQHVDFASSSSSSSSSDDDSDDQPLAVNRPPRDEPPAAAQEVAQPAVVAEAGRPPPPAVPPIQFGRPLWPLAPNAMPGQVYAGDIWAHRDDAPAGEDKQREPSIVDFFRKPAIVFLNIDKDLERKWEDNFTLRLNDILRDSLYDNGYMPLKKDLFDEKIPQLAIDLETNGANEVEQPEVKTTILFVVSDNLRGDIGYITDYATQTRLPVIVIDAFTAQMSMTTIQDTNNGAKYLSIAWEVLDTLADGHALLMTAEQNDTAQKAMKKAWERMKLLLASAQEEQAEEL